MRVSHQTAHRILVTGSILMFLMAILGAVGETSDGGTSWGRSS